MSGSGEERRRFEAYERPLVPRLYDLDVTVTSAALWGAPVERQVAFFRRAAQAAEAARGLLLEVPVGTGIVPARAAVGASRTIVAVDISAAMLARARAPSRLGERALLVRADVTRLPFRAGAFKAVHSGNGFHLFPDPAGAARELVRVLTPGGGAFVTTWVRTGRRRAALVMRVLRRLGVIDEPRTVSEYESVFDASGLAAVDATVSGALLLWEGRRRPDAEAPEAPDAPDAR